jgi:hypothetical protein
MKTRRHHNNSALTSTKRGKRKKEVERMAKKLGIPCRCGHDWSAHGDGDHASGECFYSYNCDCKGFRRTPKQDVILERPEEEPGYGHGI